MAGYVFGLGFLAFAGWQLWSDRLPAGGIEVHGTVVEEVSRKSARAGRRRPLYAPRVAYTHPRTGEHETYEPTRFSNHRCEPGDAVVLHYDPAADRVRRPLERPVKDTAVLVLVGIGFIAAQFFGG